MDRNQLIGFVLMGALLIAFILMDKGAEDKAEQGKSEIENVATPEEEKENVIPEMEVVEQSIPDVSTLDSAQKALLDQEVLYKYGIFATSSLGTEEKITLKNSNLTTELSTKGGMFERAFLTDGYTIYNTDTPIELWKPEKSDMNIDFAYNGKGVLSTKNFYFEKVKENLVASEDNPASVTLRLNTDSPNKYIEFVYSLPEGSYEIDFDLNVVGLDNVIQNNDMSLVWNAEGYNNEKSLEYERQSSSVFYREEGEARDYLRENTEKSETLEQELNWFSFKQKFFSALVISDEGFKTGAYIESKPPAENDTITNMLFAAKAPLNIENTANSNTKLRFYFGPNDYKILKGLEVEELTRIIDYGPWIIGWVNRNIVRPLFFFFSKYIGSAGIVILIITVLIKSVLFPITWKNYLSSAKMRVLKPEINAISEKFKGKDKAVEKQQATMALYRQTGVSPFAGCIPILLQMPILYAMFRFFPASIEVRGKGFLWADDLSAYDVLVNLPVDIPAYGAHISGFTVLMAASTFIYTRMNSANMPQQQQAGMPNMKVIMNIFPFIMLIFFNKFASGLSLYYFIANLISIGQMWIIKKYIIDEDKIRAKIDSNKQKPKKKSSFQSRLEEMQKQQQQTKKTKKTKKG